MPPIDFRLLRHRAFALRPLVFFRSSFAMTRLSLLTLLLCTFSCADDIAPGSDAGVDVSFDVSLDGGEVPPVSGNFRHDQEGGVVVSVGDASDYESWQYLDLDTGEATDDPARWDLSFKRFFVGINGGVSGPGNVFVARVDTSFESTTMAPMNGWETARPDGSDDDDDEADTLFNSGVDDWYEYDVSTHTLTARQRVYAVATTDGNYFKFEILGYYDDAGSPAQVSFRWGRIAAFQGELPDGGGFDGGTDAGTDAGVDGGDAGIPNDALTVDASDSNEWVYLDFDGQELAVSDPSNDENWDLAFRRSEIRTNSGLSGAGVGGAKEGEGDFLSANEVGTFDFVTDVEEDTPNGLVVRNPALGSWYDFENFMVRPSERWYAVRGADGDYAKLHVWAWDDGVYTLSLERVNHVADIREITVDTASADTWVGLRFDSGTLVPNSGAGTDWDIAVSRTRFRSNGGTSGEGAADARALDALDVHELTFVPTDGFEVDETIPGGRPGAPDYSGNPVLTRWYDYNPQTHQVSPKPNVTYVVHTENGDLAAYQVHTYDQDQASYVLRIRYAGPRRTRFH